MTVNIFIHCVCVLYECCTVVKFMSVASNIKCARHYTVAAWKMYLFALFCEIAFIALLKTNIVTHKVLKNSYNFPKGSC